MSVNVLANFFEKFIYYGSIDFCNKHVTALKNNKRCEYNSAEFKAAGFVGYCTSADAVNIAYKKLSWIFC